MLSEMRQKPTDHGFHCCGIWGTGGSQEERKQNQSGGLWELCGNHWEGGGGWCGATPCNPQHEAFCESNRFHKGKRKTLQITVSYK